ncbi:sensor histidine kinase [Nodosilinea sp. PGN35]|uniref:sensor histidine kinase n=1 Tax=Nodosilinea sp. PGN35 TaxID=3020489 RepID=UPI0023B30E8B|nr:response regulator [Nodosilinea sp. TSF1-S3]MDF0369589.1 response regulator [Nodosilinea sp. TSF1-S3]
MHKYSKGGLREDILLVDDTPDNLRVLSAMLTNQGYEVRKALSGQRAIASVQSDLPDLILLDIRMPGMDGYSVCQQLKSDPNTRDVPVIFISALDDALDKVKAFAVGGVDYVTKPFQEMEVLARIEHQLCIQRLKQQLLEHNQELARSNQELEQFAYVVSHDLQQPLQSITGFAKMMLIKYQDKLDREALDFLNRIHGSGDRMQRLIQDLLSYSKTGLQGQAMQAVDLNAVLNQVLENLDSSAKQEQIILGCASLPTVMGYETQLIQLFQNLICNAIKFVEPGVVPQIEIAALQEEDWWLLEVSDNGIGIDAQYLDKIFNMFQRTQSAESYSGTGIGLANCKKIVRNHGGRLWATSQLGSGTTFHFTLPGSGDPP